MSRTSAKWFSYEKSWKTKGNLSVLVSGLLIPMKYGSFESTSNHNQFGYFDIIKDSHSAD